jgi:hypothetical protein
VNPDLLPYNFGGTNTFDFNFWETGVLNDLFQDVCVANVVVEFTTEPCTDPCGDITGLYIYDQTTDAPVPGVGNISDGAIVDLALLPSNYYLAVETEGGIESVAISVEGINQSVENAVPFTWPNGADGGSNWNAGLGDYIVSISAYNQDNAGGSLCDFANIEFSIVDDEITSCAVNGYASENGRVFWIPALGTDFKASPTVGLTFEQHSNGSAHMFGQVVRIADANAVLAVDIWFNNKSTYAEWIAQGNEAKSPELGNESTWTFYDWDASYDNTLIGLNNLSGIVLHLYDNTGDGFGLQLGDGANSLNSNDDGISTWFDYWGTLEGSGDINGHLECESVTCDIAISSMDEDSECNQCNGASWIFVSGGAGGYSYLLNGAAVPSYNIPFDGQIDIYDLCQGDYTLTATDSQGCSETYDFSIDGGNCINPPTPPNCNLGNILWENNIDVNVLTGSAGIPQADVRLVDGSLTQYVLPIVLPAAFDGAVEVAIEEAVSWDAYLTRSSTGNQPNEQWRVIFLKDGVVQYASPYTGDLATGVQADEWIGALGSSVILPNGADQIIIAHYEDDDYGTTSSSSANSVVPNTLSSTMASIANRMLNKANIQYSRREARPVNTAYF